MPYNNLKSKKILVGTTGSIAAYKTPLLIRELIKSGAEARAILSPSASHFVSRLTLENLTRYPVPIEMFERDAQSGGAWHIELAHWCDLMIIAPCSAATLGRLANGIFDTALSTVAAALPQNIPLLIAPAMDSVMWLNPATQNNIKILKSYGAIIIPPATGQLSSGLIGPGRLPEIPVLMEYLSNYINFVPERHLKSVDFNIVDESNNQESSKNIEEILQRPLNPLQDTIEKDAWQAELEFENLKQNFLLKEINLKGKKVMVSAGPTYEKIDDIRFIANHSSGKMGFAIAAAARSAGASVTLIAGPVKLETPPEVNRIDVVSADDMYAAAFREFQDADIAILAAAVADFMPANPHNGKIKKSVTGNSLTLELVQTKDILASLASIKKQDQVLVGFALEVDNELENARKKLFEKNCDMMVLNSANKPDSGFEGDKNTITILKKSGYTKEYPPMSKSQCSLIILKEAIAI